MTNAPQSPVDWEPVPDPAAVGQPRRRFDGWQVLRVAVMVFGLLSLAFWGYWSWSVPFPAYPFMIGAPLFAAVVWYFFRSPRSPIETDIVGKTIVEVALVVGAGATWISIGRPVVGLVFIVVAALSGLIAFRRETA
ncbi:YrdB family protein [Curtobacterium sp. VKM Ac-1376]|uniref:YrdB family protein n=1 Tax=Curtobacterium sp. VKM Ac-1376 TaxID=123312 RepID=UPI00188B278E|nr:YrdB family protein [Curtobacterium sp. VKM Ac-1376]MBF4615643.1 YrdB family protein [Curtobacterium sp. VKM Ac-1376]